MVIVSGCIGDINKAILVQLHEHSRCKLLKCIPIRHCANMTQLLARLLVKRFLRYSIFCCNLLFVWLENI